MLENLLNLFGANQRENKSKEQYPHLEPEMIRTYKDQILAQNEDPKEYKAGLKSIDQQYAENTEQPRNNFMIAYYGGTLAAELDPELAQLVGEKAPLFSTRFTEPEYTKLSETLGNTNQEVAKSFLRNSEDIINWVPHDILTEIIKSVDQKYKSIEGEQKPCFLNETLGKIKEIRYKICETNEDENPNQAENFKKRFTEILDQYQK